MKNAVHVAEPDTSLAFPYQLSRFAAIIIVIVAGAVAAAAKYLKRTARVCFSCKGGRFGVEIFHLPARVCLKVLEQVGMKPANVHGVCRCLPVLPATR